MAERPWYRAYDPGVPHEIEPDPRSIPALVREGLSREPERPALVFEGARWSRGELLHEIDRFAASLSALGVGEGVRVAIHLPNLPQTVIGYQAALALGAEVVLTNPLYTGPEILHQWHDAGVRLAITADYLFDQVLAPIRSELGVERFVVATIAEYLPWPKRWLAPLVLARHDPPLAARVPPSPGVHRFRPLVRRGGTPPRVDVSSERLAVLQYTGGTTGPAKGAMLSHANLAANLRQMEAWFAGQRGENEVMMGALPLFHVFGMTVAMNWSLAYGMKLVLAPDPRDVKHLVRLIERERITILPAVPAMFNAINHLPGIEGRDLSSLKVCVSGSAPIAPDVLETFERLTGARILEGFGMSETSPVTHVNPLRGARKIGSIGLPLPSTDARIVDAELGERELPPGEAGELCIAGPQVTSGYWNRPEETAHALRDGWLYTGDLAEMDPDGYFRIVGRKKDMINAGGYKIFPDEVDAVLVSHPDVLEAATIGVPDPKRGETTKSFVVARPGATLDLDALREFCRERLAAYKVPREFEVLPELPKSSVMKVLRRELRERELRRRGEAGAARAEDG